MATLSCSNISKRFGGVQALERVSIAFPEAAITAIIGPNGAGKTTLINVLTGYERPDCGTCFLGRTEITGQDPSRIARAGVGRTFQGVKLAYRMSTLENLELAHSSTWGESFAAVFTGSTRVWHEQGRQQYRALEEIGLADMAERPAGELSYGQAKLLSLACAMGREPEVLILDEPVAGIDDSNKDVVLSMIKKRQALGWTTVFIEHDIQLVSTLAEYLLILNAGRVVFSGTVAEALSRASVADEFLT